MIELVVAALLAWLAWHAVRRSAKTRSAPPATVEQPSTRSRDAPAASVASGWEAQPGIRDALQALDGGRRVVVVTGRAGTGKSTFIHKLRERDGRRRTVVLAPTGIAAVNVRGQTIHRFFKLPPRLLDPDDADRFGRRLDRTLVSKIDRVIIDEISMVRADLLDAVDASLRRGRAVDAPFGGVQMVLVGDFMQLPPVVPREEAELLERLGYATPFAFHARVLERVEPIWIELPTVHRQADPRFVAWLGNIRNGESLEPIVRELNEACHRPHRAGSTPIVLCPTNARADRYNDERLQQLRGPTGSYECRLTGDFERRQDRLPAPDVLRLRVGARVLAVKNDPGERWVNGSLGEVTALHDDHVMVRFDHGGTHEVARATWETIRYRWNDRTGRVEDEVTGTFSQIPLGHGWALTIHKAQGLTLADVRIDFGQGAFAPGQAYVALSRAQSLEGLSLERPLRVDDIRVDDRIVRHLRRVLHAG